MGRVEAAELVKGIAGVEVHGNSLRIIFSYKGVRCRESLGLAPTKKNVKFAVGLRSTVLHEIKTKCFDYQARFPDSSNAARLGRIDTLKEIKLEKLKEKYLPIKAVDIGSQTLRRYKDGLKVCITLLDGESMVSSLTPENIYQLRADLIATRKPATVNHYLACLRGMLEFAEANRYTDLKLSECCKRFKIGKSQPYPLELEEYQRIMNDPLLHPSHRNLITLSVYTGLRTGEARALAWEDIDLEKGTIKVQRNIAKDDDGEFFKLPKTDSIRTIYLLPPALEALKAQRQYTELFPAIAIVIHLDKQAREKQTVRPVFRPTTALPHENHHAIDSVWYSESSLSSQWRNILKRCKVTYRRIYQTRHTFACWQLTAHGNIAFIADQMGHTDYSMLVKKYGRWMNTESQNEVARIWSALEGKGHASCKVVKKCPNSAP